MPDTGPLVQDILPAAGEFPDNPEALHPLALGDVLLEDHILCVPAGPGKTDSVLGLGGRAAGDLFHLGGQRGAKLLPEQGAKLLEPLDVPGVEEAVSVRGNVQVEAGVVPHRGQVRVKQAL